MRKAMKDGRWVYTPPKGYKMRRDELNKPLMVQNEDAKFIKEGFELYATGLYSKCEVRKMLEKKGFKLSKNAFTDTLRNPLYCGKIFIPEYRDENEILVKGLHEPIVDDELFMKCQQVENLSKRNAAKPQAKNDMLPLRGHLECKVCDSTLTGSGSKGNGGKYFYYHCQSGCKERFRADDAHNGFDELLKSLKVKPEIAALYMAVMEDIFSTEEGDRKAELKKLQKEINDFEEKLLGVDEKFVIGDLEKDSYKRLKDRYSKQKWELQQRKSDMETMDTAFNQYLKWGCSLLADLPTYYDGASIEVKQKIVGSIFPEKLVFDNGNYRTNRVNEVVGLLCSNDRGFSLNKKGQDSKIETLPCAAPRAGLEPATP